MLSPWREQTTRPNENIFKRNILVGTSMYTHDRACASIGKPRLASLQFWSSGSKHRLFTLQYSFGDFEEMAESQIKSKGQKIATGCRHFTAEWDSHHYCWACRDKKKGDDVCVTSKKEDCYICLQFSSDQKKKLKAKKAYQFKKAKDISKDLEDSLLGSDDPPSATTASSAATSSPVEKSSTVDPLQLILQRLDSMQGRLVALEKGSTSVSSNEVNVAEATPVSEEANRKKTTSLNTFAVMEEEEFPEDFSEHRSAKRACSVSPHQSDKQSSVREEEVEDDPSYRQLLASVRNILVYLHQRTLLKPLPRSLDLKTERKSILFFQWCYLQLRRLIIDGLSLRRRWLEIHLIMGKGCCQLHITLIHSFHTLDL